MFELMFYFMRRRNMQWLASRLFFDYISRFSSIEHINKIRRAGEIRTHNSLDRND